MDELILAHDLGTGGNKASLYNSEGACLVTHFEPYDTFYPQRGRHEQRPMDWWQAVLDSTRTLIDKAGIKSTRIRCCAVSGHSLGVIPLDKNGMLLQDLIPIWSDARADQEAREFFKKIPEQDWYMETGNGFPAPLYSVFKLMWLKNNVPDLFNRIDTFIGTKDFINYLMTGALATDHSYASGFGIYDLKNNRYSASLLAASELPTGIFPNVIDSTACIGSLSKDAAAQLGLEAEIEVMAGGVDNSCMALGAMAYKQGRTYLSLGSSSWIALSSEEPILDTKTKPFVFSHVVPGQFVSATSIFSAGSSLKWVRDNLCKDLTEQAEKQGGNAYDLMIKEAAESPIGANGLIFNPNLAGGTSQDYHPNQRGAFVGLDLGHTRHDVIRASLEGISMGLRTALDALRSLAVVHNPMLIVGGGGTSGFWRQTLADIFSMEIVKSNVDQDAAALGAAAIAAVGSGLWSDFEPLDRIHRIEHRSTPKKENTKFYEDRLKQFDLISRAQADLAIMREM
ncbi:MAG: xylulokinase [Desulfocapsaceae bacterium]